MNAPLLIWRIAIATFLTVCAVLVGSVVALVLCLSLYCYIVWATARAVWEVWK